MKCTREIKAIKIKGKGRRTSHVPVVEVVSVVIVVEDVAAEERNKRSVDMRSTPPISVSIYDAITRALGSF